MTAWAFDARLAGLKIPENYARNALRLLVVLAASSLSAVIFQAERPGSVIALCLLLPALFILWEARARLLRAKANLLCLSLLLLSLGSIALEPGPLNLALAWSLLLGNAVVLPQAGDRSPLSVLEAMLGHLTSGVRQSVRDGLFSVALALAFPLAASRPKIAALVLPVLAFIVFSSLLVIANPIIERFLASFEFADPLWLMDWLWAGLTSLWFTIFALSFALLWPILRGSASLRNSPAMLSAATPRWHHVFFQPATVVATLLVLNALFAAENLLDIAYVWGEAQLPPGMTHADYVHRGSYTLIATAILAALLMIFILRKGTATEQSPHVRRLTYLWAVQNLFLVASSAKRTLSYVADYGWTEWRISGLIWMALVFFGLASIALRILLKRDTLWLINTNLLASLLLLLACSAWDMRGFIAIKNVERSLATTNLGLDYHYLLELGPAALPALEYFMAKQRQTLPEQGLAPYYCLKQEAELLRIKLARQQADWRSWTWRGHIIQRDLAEILPDATESGMNRER